MNKLKLIEMIKQLIQLYKQGLLTASSFQKVEEDILTPSLNEDFLSYKETEFICFIFREFPYYQVLPKISDICTQLNTIAHENPKTNKNATISLIVAYFSELFINISARVNTEINVHIFELIHYFYHHRILDCKKTITSLKRNSCSPESLTGLLVANQIQFEQITILGFENPKGELREKISRSNYKKRSSIENNVQKNITKFYDEDSFEKFLISLNTCFDTYHQEQPKDCELLKDEILMQLNKFYQQAKKSWNGKKDSKEDNYQYKLEFFNT